jgi:hypothetical protein
VTLVEVVNVRAKGAFYRPAWRAERSGGRRSLMLVEFYFGRWFPRWNGERGGGEVAPIEWESEGGGGGAGLFWLHARLGGWLTAAHGVAAPGEAVASGELRLEWAALAGL